MSVPDDEGLDQYAPGIVEAMQTLGEMLGPLQAAIDEHGVTVESMRMAAALLRTGAENFDRLAQGLEDALT